MRIVSVGTLRDQLCSKSKELVPKHAQASRMSLMPKSRACERTALVIWACMPCASANGKRARSVSFVPLVVRTSGPPCESEDA